MHLTLERLSTEVFEQEILVSSSLALKLYVQLCTHSAFKLYFDQWEHSVDHNSQRTSNSSPTLRILLFLLHQLIRLLWSRAGSGPWLSSTLNLIWKNYVQGWHRLKTLGATSTIYHCMQKNTPVHPLISASVAKNSKKVFQTISARCVDFFCFIFMFLHTGLGKLMSYSFFSFVLGFSFFRSSSSIRCRKRDLASVFLHCMATLLWITSSSCLQWRTAGVEFHFSPLDGRLHALYLLFIRVRFLPFFAFHSFVACCLPSIHLC